MEQPRRDTRAVALGVLALHFMIEALGDEPVRPSFDLRALLAFLHLYAGGERRHYDGFWKTVTAPFEGQTQRGYMRRTWARSHWWGIHRAAEGDPAFAQTYSTLGHQYRLKHEANYADRCKAAHDLRVAGLLRGLEGRKGHPRNAAEARLAAYMRANGGSATGFRLDGAAADEG